MDFLFKKPYEGNEKPIMQHVQGGVLTEWRVDRERDAIVREAHVIDDAPGPRAGTFFLGGMETTRDELADYVEEMRERNTKPRPDRIPEIQKKIADLRERHVAAIKWGVQQKAAGVTLPRTPIRPERKFLLVPKAVGTVNAAGEMTIVRVRR